MHGSRVPAVVLLLLLPLLGAPAAPAQNLLANGEFDDDADGWTLFDPNTTYFEYDGDHRECFNSPSGAVGVNAEMSNAEARLETCIPALPPNELLDARARIFVPLGQLTGGSAYIELVWNLGNACGGAASGSVASAAVTEAGAGAWTLVTLDGVQPDPNALSAKLALVVEKPEAGATFEALFDGVVAAAAGSTRIFADGVEVGEVCRWTLAVYGNSPPDGLITDGPEGSVNSTDADFEFGANPPAGAKFQCRLSPDLYLPCVSPLSYAGLAEGPHQFHVKACAANGNCDPSPASRFWTVDTAAPETMILTGPSGTVNDDDPQFTFSGGDDFHCQLDGASYAPCSSPHVYTNVPDGGHTFRVYGCDLAANCDPTPATRSWTIDTGP